MAQAEISLLNYMKNNTFGLSVAQGELEGMTFIEKFGENGDVDTGTYPEDVWDFGGTYTFSTTADIDTISSSNASDTQEITIVGQNADYVEVTQTVDLNGQTKVTLDTPLMRVYRAYNSNSTDLLGDVYIYVDGAISGGIPDTDEDVRAMIKVEHGQTLMAIYTIPAGYTGYFLKGYVALTLDKNGESAGIVWKARTDGGVFRTQSAIGLNSAGSSSWQYEYVIPLPLPEKTDVKITCEEVSNNNTAISGGFTVLLVRNKE